jgi:hypothetical protein
MSLWASRGKLRDIYVFRTADGASPAHGPLIERRVMAASSRNSSKQAGFRATLIHRDGPARGKPSCALCSSDSEVQAAHIVPHSSPVATMESVELSTLDDPRNGFLLCDPCHDCFDHFLWSVKPGQNVVLSNALKHWMPSLVKQEGKKLFVGVTDISLPLPSVWRWH